MSRKRIIAANWKMNPPPQGWDAEDSPFRPREDVEVLVFPTMLDVHSCVESFLTVGGQCGRPELNGAFTGDVSMQLLAQHGCRYVLCGHSERRIYHAENDASIAKQVEAAIAAGLVPILCVGETADERELGKEKEAIARQLNMLLTTNYQLLTHIAYEPVWAIGTGKTATPDDAQDMHAFIRTILPSGENARLLYGGSVKPQSAPDLIAQPDIDGFLVGSAALNTADFGAIVESCIEPA